ncbi:hypothetical protein GCM10022225_50090 [Plantactinospora mayteni]|uniref:DUF3800 domain-containing protein n=1 Tax=Plantactinospora mayteni TaxID=566021 RepID=A0ABQ4EY13_9ACTN|nr:hypothetical protein [Plantactinospora mayteni]GIG99507.1 hypothetical protein Pma05_60800 [Plantactinospora mayteni]
MAGSDAADQPVEIACDESGSEGERLVGGVTDVFAHASSELDSAAATACVLELRDRIRSPATEYKANHLLREKHRRVLVWLLGAEGPLSGYARVHLTEKTFFVVGKLVNLLVEDLGYDASLGLYQGHQATALARALYREGPAALGAQRWTALLGSFNYLLRPRNRRGVRVSVDSFFELVEVLGASAPAGFSSGGGGPAGSGTSTSVGEIVGLLRAARPRLESLVARLHDDPRAVPELNPILPALVRAVTYWSGPDRPVSIVHDIQTGLTAESVAQLRELFGKPDPALVRCATGAARPYAPSGRLTGLTFAESHLDSRVQVADFLAGTARRIASDDLNGRGDPELTALLRPYVDGYSIWGDAASRLRLLPAAR